MIEELHSVEGHLTGRQVSLRPVVPRDYEALYTMAASDSNNFRWRLRGSTPDPEHFKQQLWTGTVLQFVLHRGPAGQPLGLVSLYGEDSPAGFAKFAVLLHPEARGRAWPIEAVSRFLDYAFVVRSLRKIYIEVPEFNLPLMERGLKRFFETEAILRDYCAFDGRLWEQHILSTTRAKWFEASPTAKYLTRDSAS